MKEWLVLQEILDSFEATEFWYTEQGSTSGKTRSGSFRRIIQPQPQPQRKEEKWWLPVVCVPSDGLSEKSRKNLRHKCNCANQIHKAAMAINSCILSEMGIPDSYIASLPKVSICQCLSVLHKIPMMFEVVWMKLILGTCVSERESKRGRVHLSIHECSREIFTWISSWQPEYKLWTWSTWACRQGWGFHVYMEKKSMLGSFKILMGHG